MAARWTAPVLPKEAELANRLILNNSLSDEKAPFYTIDPNQKIIRWYICGPTVYDSAHLGHARAYVTFDIIARLLTEYFGYELIYVMNITDIDDKIILRARRNYLLKEYVSKVSKVADLEKEVLDAVAKLKAKRDGTVKELKSRPPKNAKPAEEKDWKNRVSEAETKLNNIAAEEKQATVALDKLKKAGGLNRELVDAVVNAAYDSVTEWLDKLHGDSVSDQQIFRAHAAYYENEFLEDMKSLGVREPTVLTRVSEYVDKIVTYIQKIISEGVAYESNGSVYFDVGRFSESHWYAKLAPEHRGNLDLAEEGEGAIGSATSDKRNPADFALWKKSKSGEPFWESPWGKGRPGWHIECSVMASDILGSQIDIHSGGIDLKFPHHDNELAQAEAHDHSQQWINYFLHAGHLGIDGLKMSKSLKNFRTIRDILQNFSARVLRLFFLSVAWDGPMNFNEQPLAEAAAKDKQLNEFFLNVKVAIRGQGTIGSVSQHWDALDRQLHDQLLQFKTDIHKALLNNFDFPRAFALLIQLVGATNGYLKASKGPKALLLKSVATYAHKILRAFGVIPFDDFGFTASSGESSSAGASEAVLAPYLDAFAAFRDEIRSSSQKKLDHKILLQLCDKLRDDILPQLGVRLEDRSDAPSVWKLENPETLMKQRADKIRAALSQQISKLSNKLVLKKKDLDRSVESSKPTAEKFAEMKKYSKYDDKGVPTHDADGKELSKPQRKNAEKDHSTFEKAYEKHQQAVAKDPDYITKLQQEIADIEVELKALEAQQKEEAASS